MMIKATKRAVTVEAIKWDGTVNSYFEVMHFTGVLTQDTVYDKDCPSIEIETPEGTMRAMTGDYIIKGIKGEFYPCKADIFEQTYDMHDGTLNVTTVDSFDKTLHNSDASGARENVKDIQFFGDGDTFQLICKASSQAENWMKSTKAMQIDGVGCVVQVTTQQGDHVAEAVTFVPDTVIVDIDGDPKNGRKLVKIGEEKALFSCKID